LANTIVAATLTTSSEGNASLVDPLLDQTTCQIAIIIADGVYDSEPTYQTVAEHEPATTAVITPRSTAVLRSTAVPTQHYRNIQSPADKGRLGWQRVTDHGWKHKEENAMARCKRILRDHMLAQKLSGQQVKAAISPI
jgi:hypothetical protein